jgi:magnesium transporter
MKGDPQNNGGITWFLYDLLGKPVTDDGGSRMGRVFDLTADVREHDPPITGLVVSGPNRSRLFLPWGWVEGIASDGVRTRAGAHNHLVSPEFSSGEVLLKKSFLDKQIVDMEGAKVLRVNDLQLSQRNGTLILAKVDVGLRGLLRRVGLLRIILPSLKWVLGYTLTDTLINWRLVQPVGSSEILRLRFSQTRLAHLHPAELADILEDLDRPERARVFRALDIDTAAEVLEESDPKVQVQLIQHLPTETASDVLEQMSPSTATDLLQDLEETRAQSLLDKMEPEVAEDVRSLLSHDEEEAGGIMTTSFFSQSPEVTVTQALSALRQEARDLDVLYYIYVSDQGGRLLGILSLRDLLTSDPGASLESIMERRIVSVPLEADKGDITNLFIKYGLRAVPVMDEEGRIQGVIRFEALIDLVAPHLGQ